MVRIILQKINVYGDINNYKNYIEAAGSSTDDKPTENIVSGSLFMESDTGKVFVFDEGTNNWTEIGG